jgi:ABC-type multidrug transport system permease subunit
MKMLSVIGKNFRLILRGKASGFIVLLGPLLIILLISLFFNGKSSYDFSVGYFAPEKSNLSDSFISSLKSANFSVREFNDEASCVEKIKQGVINTCIIFPKNFKLKNDNSNELRFLVDYSRINLVYKVIDSVSGNLESESKEVSYSLTNLLLTRINSTVNDIVTELALAAKSAEAVNKSYSDVDKSGANAASMKLDVSQISTSGLKNSTIAANDTLYLLQNQSLLLLEKTHSLIDELDNYLNASEISDITSDVDELVAELNDTQNLSYAKISLISDQVSRMENSLATLQSDLAASKVLNDDTKARLASAKKSLSETQMELSGLKRSLLATKANLQSISINSAEAIVSPVNTKIEPIVADTSNMLFTFPFLLVLTIMFVALFLSSTLVVFEKNSKAYFRNFVTPTNPQLFTIASFLTCFLIILAQAVVILCGSQLFLGIHAWNNVVFVTLIILCTIMFFVALGMLIGKFFSTQEGAVMVSVIIGSVFLFASNLVIPLESLAPTLSNIIKYNPFIITSDLLRKAFLFQPKLSETYPTLLIIFGISLIILFFLLMSQHKGRKQHGRSKENNALHSASLNEQSNEESESKTKPFVIGQRKAENTQELLSLVSEMTKSEFEDNVSTRQNKIAEWIESELKDKKLAFRLKKTASRSETVKILSNDVKKHKSKDDSSSEDSEDTE